MLLLSDGRVMAANNLYQRSFIDQIHGIPIYGNKWFALTPDQTGHYVNGSRTNLASMADTGLGYASQVLTNGKVFVAGAEYGTDGAKAGLHDTAFNVWIPLQLPANAINPGQTASGYSRNQAFYDCDSMPLPNGNVLLAPVFANARFSTVNREYSGCADPSPVSNLRQSRRLEIA